MDELLERGDYVVATLRRPEVLAELQKTWSKQLLVLALDVSKPEAVGNAFQAVKNRFGRIDVLVNNAGGGAFAEVEGTPDEVGRNLFEVNFWGQLTVSAVLSEPLGVVLIYIYIYYLPDAESSSPVYAGHQQACRRTNYTAQL